MLTQEIDCTHCKGKSTDTRLTFLQKFSIFLVITNKDCGYGTRHFCKILFLKMPFSFGDENPILELTAIHNSYKRMTYG
jgi:hypothetical protein